MYGMLLIPHKDHPHLAVNGFSYEQLDAISNIPFLNDQTLVLESILYNLRKIKSVHLLPFKQCVTEQYVFPIRYDGADFNLSEYAKTNLINDISLTIPDNVIADVKNNKCKILIDYIAEPFDLVSNYTKSTVNTAIQQTITKYDLKNTDVVLITANPISLTTAKYPVVIKHWGSCFHKPMSDEFIQYQTQLILNRTDRKYKSVLLVNKARFHRLKLLEQIFLNNLTEDNILTCRADTFLEKNKDRFDKNFVDSLPWTYDLTDKNKQGYNLFIEEKEKNLYLDSYVNFVAETVIKSTNPYYLDLSEKPYKAILSMQPFVIYGQSGILAYLKSKGYKTFDRWWDESYDYIDDLGIKRRAIFKIYSRLSTMSRKELSNLMLEMLPTLQHNEQLYRSHYTAETENKNLLDTLDKCFDK